METTTTAEFFAHDGAFKIYSCPLQLQVWVETVQAAKSVAELLGQLDAVKQENSSSSHSDFYTLRPTHNLETIRKYLTECGFKEVLV